MYEIVVDYKEREGIRFWLCNHCGRPNETCRELCPKCSECGLRFIWGGNKNVERGDIK